jgi:hypothetical protein
LTAVRAASAIAHPLNPTKPYADLFGFAAGTGVDVGAGAGAGAGVGVGANQAHVPQAAQEQTYRAPAEGVSEATSNPGGESKAISVQADQDQGEDGADQDSL